MDWISQVNVQERGSMVELVVASKLADLALAREELQVVNHRAK